MFKEVVFGFPYYRTKKMLRLTEHWSPDSLLQLQKNLLMSVLRHAIEHIPYYQKRLDMRILSGIENPQELIRGFPFIDKQEIRANLMEFINGFKLKRLKVTTGGSTGVPLAFYLDRFVTRQMEKAFIFDLWSRVGYRFGDSIVNLRGRTPKNDNLVEYSRLFNTYYLSSLNLSRKTIASYVGAMNSIRPRYLHGYPSTVYQMALLIESFGLKLDHQLKAVLCGSEKLFEYQKKKIEAVFGCRVFHWYGHSEYCALGGECEHSSLLHFYPQYGYVELLPTDLRTDQNETIFELTVTGFNNKVMPLIRYRTGDYVVSNDKQSCQCGRPYLLIHDVIGREQEFVVDANEVPISATSLIFGQHYSLFEGVNSIRLRQDLPGTLEIIISKNESFNDRILENMKAALKRLLGDRMKVEFSFEDEPPKSPLGKEKLVDQKLNVRKYLS